MAAKSSLKIGCPSTEMQSLGVCKQTALVLLRHPLQVLLKRGTVSSGPLTPHAGRAPEVLGCLSRAGNEGTQQANAWELGWGTEIPADPLQRDTTELPQEAPALIRLPEVPLLQHLSLQSQKHQLWGGEAMQEAVCNPKGFP